MARPESPKPTTSEQPFWLARPDADGESRIIFQTAKPHDVSRFNAFSASDVLQAAGLFNPSEAVNDKELEARAIALGVDHEEAIAGLKIMIEKRGEDPIIRMMQSETAIFGYSHNSMHRWGD